MNDNLLGFLKARPRAVGEAFRTNPRHQSRRRALVSWQQGRESRTVKARLIDISRMGVALTASTPPPSSAVVCIRLVGSTPTPWIEGDVVGIEPTDGTYRIRIKFREPCPTIMIKSAVLAPQTSEEKTASSADAKQP
ncbi:PilZ domain-containing protein [Singulisphaera acidiphila]|uniref:PilZ domain-containing protein n=1 Tax=Singulisphaera acidiphila (strain ATCC BAA-1392 / DSM 18658 / VKM B-2454 / MOB10) TaxID=886293 RepID=L0DN81_SINAD|nr:PilZ domain-containing protein [Singulisphaera acidiphila]AGA30285.1 PilZ domain-containing protein [Singulisphaera acidiphila DSM 18658]